ncbi:MAG: pyruvate kinase [Proteobacteria bacterium]|nr:pyruvate kinase [Pseudomonadota bacterium]
MRRAKIVCTIGPVTSSEKQLEALIENGMDVARLNFSHGDHAFHGDIIDKIRKISQKLKKNVAILQDLQGIKIRVGGLKGGKIHLNKGEQVYIMTGDDTGDEKHIFVSYPWLVNDARPGDTILLDDGLMKLQVLKKEKDFLTAEVIEGGVLKEHKGVNLPHMKIKPGSFMDKDKKDLEFGIQKGVDFVALSFVRTATDVTTVRKWLSKKGANIPIIAKIEKEEAIHNIDSILNEVDGIMVARGDLGVEMPLEEVPMYQKMLIEKANKSGRLVITATQMLESMTQHSRPTRAETTDVANAVIDGTDALMLSGETSAGKYPIEALKVMNRIIVYTENAEADLTKAHASTFIHSGLYEFPEAIAHAVSHVAEDVGAGWIVAFTRSGFTARLISKFKPHASLIAFSPEEEVVRQMALYWGVSPYYVKHIESTDEMINEVDSLLVKLGYAKKGDRIIIVASHPPSISSGKTNFMKMHVVGG